MRKSLLPLSCLAKAKTGLFWSPCGKIWNLIDAFSCQETNAPWLPGSRFLTLSCTRRARKVNPWHCSRRSLVRFPSSPVASKETSRFLVTGIRVFLIPIRWRNTAVSYRVVFGRMRSETDLLASQIRLLDELPSAPRVAKELGRLYVEIDS